MDTKRRRWIDTAEVATLIRADLKRAFPAQVFSVKISRYAGGSSIRVNWIEGPQREAVEALVNGYAGASFDSSIDLQSYHDGDLDGETVHFGSDYVFCRRTTAAEAEESARWRRVLAAQKAAKKAARSARGH